MEEIYDKIGRYYPYTYIEFLESFTPRLANKFTNIIDIRENNEYCYNAMMHGVNMKNKIIQPEFDYDTIEKPSDDEILKAEEDFFKRLKNGN